MTEEIGHMGYKTYTQIFENGIPYAVKLNWRGEPLLHKEIAKFVKYAKNMGVLEVLLNTNGLLLDRETALSLAEVGLDWLIISADGATKDTYEFIRTGGDFEVLVKNIIRTWYLYQRLEHPPKIRIQICPQPANRHELRQWRRFFSPFANSLRIGKLFDPQGKKGFGIKIPRSCPSFWQRLTIGWQGNIYPCPSDYLGHFYLGNIHETKICDAWHSSRMNYWRYILTKWGRKETIPCKNCSSYCK